MRVRYSIIFTLLIAALLFCTIQGRKSRKPFRKSFGLLESALIPPVVGNLLIVASSDRSVALLGHYIYYLGMDLVMYALVNFTNTYCKGIGKGNGSHKPTVMYVALIADAIQMLLNPILGHAFDIEPIDVEGTPYYRIVPFFGQTIHRIVDYSVFLCVILIFTIASIKTAKLYREKYTMILVSMAAVGIFQTYFIFSKSPIDRSMIGYGVFGIIIYYFAIEYRPLRLLDQMLSGIVSDLSDSFYIFDPSGHCLWANAQGCHLVGVEPDEDIVYDEIGIKLMQMFGDAGLPEEHTAKRSIGEGESTRYYEMEENQVKDKASNLTGSYLRIRDVTLEESKLRQQEAEIGQISQEAYKDALTEAGNKAAYNKAVSELNKSIAEGLTAFAVVMVDMNHLKQINDEYGHKAGDAYIKGCCRLICDTFKHSPVFRIGGDEFAAILTNDDYRDRSEKVEMLRAAYSKAFLDDSEEPWERYSAAVGIAEYASDDSSYELVFKRADKAMYEEKAAFKKQYGSYR